MVAVVDIMEVAYLAVRTTVEELQIVIVVGLQTVVEVAFGSSEVLRIAEGVVLQTAEEAAHQIAAAEVEAIGTLAEA